MESFHHSTRSVPNPPQETIGVRLEAVYWWHENRKRVLKRIYPTELGRQRADSVAGAFGTPAEGLPMVR
jgi:hypothetical protein